MRYVEDQHGNIVDGFSAAMMQRGDKWMQRPERDITRQWLQAFLSLDFVT